MGKKKKKLKLIRYIPRDFDADDVIDVIGSYGYENDTISVEPYFTNDAPWRITVKVEKAE